MSETVKESLLQDDFEVVERSVMMAPTTIMEQKATNSISPVVPAATPSDDNYISPVIPLGGASHF